MLRILSILLLLSILCPTQSYACSCAPEQSVEEAYESSSAIFLGEVVKKQKLSVLVKPERAWKGDFSKDVEVFTAESSALCGYPFELNKSYLIYASVDRSGALNAFLCSRTKLGTESSAEQEQLTQLLQSRAKAERIDRGIPLDTPGHGHHGHGHHGHGNDAHEGHGHQEDHDDHGHHGHHHGH